METITTLIQQASDIDLARAVRFGAPVALLTLFWCWETWRPFFGSRAGRLTHALRNLAIALFNSVLLGLVFGSLTVATAEWAGLASFGLLHLADFAPPLRFALALILLDAWMYVWHRANHMIPILWRFHRMHHTDRHVDVTSATRFHLGEHVGAALLRLGVIALAGIEVWHLVVYDTLVIAITQFHHADISLGRWDRRLRWLIVTPYMHKVHHSDWQPETDSNYSVVLSIWDRLAGTFRMRVHPRTIVFGLADFSDPTWQTWWGMWKTPLVGNKPDAAPPTEHHDAAEVELAATCGTR
jgi:sterol desaturase/sphingolipid hydroxylase (fatty acid hydroxylase superfamily)